jgi:hypothetical protein
MGSKIHSIHRVGTAYYAVPTDPAGRIHCRGTACRAPAGASAAQVSMEYIIIFVVILAAILTVGIIDKSRGSFGQYLTKASAVMTTVHDGDPTPASLGRAKAGGGEVAVGPGLSDAGDGSQYGEGDAERAKQDALAKKQKARDDLQAQYEQAKRKLERFKDEYAQAKKTYDLLKAALDWFGVWPEFKYTPWAKEPQQKIDIYESLVEALAAALTEMSEVPF